MTYQGNIFIDTLGCLFLWAHCTNKITLRWSFFLFLLETVWYFREMLIWCAKRIGTSGGGNDACRMDIIYQNVLFLIPPHSNTCPMWNISKMPFLILKNNNLLTFMLICSIVLTLLHRCKKTTPTGDKYHLRSPYPTISTAWSIIQGLQKIFRGWDTPFL